MRRHRSQQLDLERLEERDLLSYSIMDLGVLPNFPYIFPTAINAVGQVVGYVRSSGFPSVSHAFLWDGTMTDLGTLGGTDSAAAGINASGQIVGHSRYTGGGEYDGHAFLYEDGSMIDLGTLGGDGSSGAQGINDKGYAVGIASVPSGDYHAFVYDGKVMADLGTLGFRNSIAYAINNWGEIVGDADVGGGHHHAVSYRDGAVVDLGTLGYDSIATAINDSGDIAGYSTVPPVGSSHAFLIHGGKMTDLGTFGGPGSAANGINNLGQVVGSASTDRASHAFVYEDGKMSDLNDLIPPNSGWVLMEATGTNDGGQIVGYGRAPGGINHGFILTPDDGDSRGRLSPSLLTVLTEQTAPQLEPVVLAQSTILEPTSERLVHATMPIQSLVSASNPIMSAILSCRHRVNKQTPEFGTFDFQANASWIYSE